MLRVQLWCERPSLNSMAQIHTSVTPLTSSDLTWSPGRLTRQHASHISVAHISWDVTYVSSAHHCCRLFAEMEEMLVEKMRQRTFSYDTKAGDTLSSRHVSVQPGTHYPHVTWAYSRGHTIPTSRELMSCPSFGAHTHTHAYRHVTVSHLSWITCS